MTDLYRPQYHFMPQKNWMNDPNGPVWFDGCYHMFYQYNPAAPVWGDIHWGHAESRDLVNWRHLPPALAPGGQEGEKHCFSGCAVVDENGVPTLFYTSVGDGARNARTGAFQCMAQSHDGMRTWQKDPRPILENSMHPEMVLEWRDPFVWREEDGWHMLLGGSLGGYGFIGHYRAQQLDSWQYLGPALIDEDAAFLECPNLISFGARKVLVYSPCGEVVYRVGGFDEKGAFVTEKSGILDHSSWAGFYAPNTLLNDPQGRMLMWGWSPEDAARNGFLKQADYNGALSLPRVLELDAEGNLRQRPAAEVESLRGEAFALEAGPLDGTQKALPHRGRSWELRLNAHCGAEDDFSLFLLATDDGQERTALHYKAGTGQLTLEKGLTSLDGAPGKGFQRSQVPLEDGRLELRVFLDHSIVEIFANGREVITGRLYPTRPDADGIYLAGRAAQVEAEGWVMRPAEFTGAV